MHAIGLIKEKIDVFKRKLKTLKVSLGTIEYSQIFSFKVVSLMVIILMLPIAVIAEKNQQVFEQHASTGVVQMSQAAQISSMRNQARLSGQILRFATTIRASALQQAAEDHNKAMQYLISYAPNIALQEALSSSEKQALPLSVQPLIEDQGSITGEYEVVHQDTKNGEGKSYQTVLANNGIQYLLHFAENSPGIPNRARVTITGVRYGADIALHTSSIQTQGQVLTGTVMGNTRVAVVLVNFTSNTSKPANVGKIQQEVFGPTSSTADYSVNGFMHETSYNPLQPSKEVNLVGDVYDWVTLDVDTNSCQYTGWYALGFFYNKGWMDKVDDAIQTRNNVNLLNSYDHIIYAFDHVNACDPEGQFVQGLAFNEKQAVITDFSGFTWTFEHEIGHEFGLAHAGGFNCGVQEESGKFILTNSNCEALSHLNEYWDPYDIMGNSSPDRDDQTFQYENYQKMKLGWLTPANIQTVTNNGTYTIYPSENNSGVVGIRIPRKDASGNIQSYFFLEYRQPITTIDGNLAGLDITKILLDGIIIRLTRDYSQRYLCSNGPCVDSVLLYIPNATSQRMHVLSQNSTFYDPETKITIQIISPPVGSPCINGGCEMVNVSFTSLNSPTSSIYKAAPNLCQQHNGDCVDVAGIIGRYRYKCPPVGSQDTAISTDTLENNACQQEYEGTVCCLPVNIPQNTQPNITSSAPTITSAPTSTSITTKCGGVCVKSTQRYCAINSDMSHPDSCERSSCNIGELCWY